MQRSVRCRVLAADTPGFRNAAPTRDEDVAAREIANLLPFIDPDRYMSMVGRTIEYIAAGDIFQANIAQRFSAEFHGSARELCIAAMEASQPWYGAYIEA